jgi:hypothetical protein
MREPGVAGGRVQRANSNLKAPPLWRYVFGPEPALHFPVALTGEHYEKTNRHP